MSRSELPYYDLSRIEQRRDTLITGLEPYVGREIGGVRFTRMVAAIQDRLPKGIRSDVLTESVRYIAGTTPDKPALVHLAWRIAAHVKELKKRIVVREWVSQRADEWAPAQIIRCWRGRDRYNNLGHAVRFRMLAGTTTGMTVDTFWKRTVLYMIADRIGFTRFGQIYKIRDLMECVGLRLFVKLDAERSGTVPAIRGTECPAYLIKWNREHVLKLRRRQDVECPNNWKHECYKCAIGYKTCPGSVHRDDYYQDYCAGCQQTHAVFDPEMGADRCRDCVIKGRVRREER